MISHIKFTWVITLLWIILNGSNIKTETEVTKGEIEHAEIPDENSILLLDYIKQNNLEERSSGSVIHQNHPISCTVNDAEIYNSRSRSRVATPDKSYRWKTDIHFFISPKFNIQQNITIVMGLTRLARVLKGCLIFRLIPKLPTQIKQYVIIRPGSSKTVCNSDLGKMPNQPQHMNLGTTDCIYESVVIHEAMHSLGVHHEHNRPDRDNHILIFNDNIELISRNQFIKLNDSFPVFKTAYDIKSIMHYGGGLFSRNISGKKRPTMLTKKNGYAIPDNFNITSSDTVRLKAMYCKGQ